ncbi:MAG: dienelactone hydrolase family protein [Pseudotabrizicola sp.]|uniref:alpha/beta hydrolase n=1 Tax=Pseudotabrizicola sp. TaxID=2939647 RepID=UPI0027286E4D|nr:dienelactone hydrolase family protein [Pseudotabrizicola sp.]MDO8883984.1 dienelactone hydrolase family protein [Pseudotabrizicola sp.]MDP2081004.1 dienelactone hydrolase family protein [Pseudotabrizicola sp.]MDZ7573636.1 dienelactone hydrolase family protein [Pseudotabrizicola sp.]
MIARLPQAATQGLVMLHGRGGSGADILSLLDHAGLPDVAAVAPEAPGNSWWPSSFLAPFAQMEPFVERGLAEVAAGVSRLEQAGLARSAIWLCGFSQGACLALEAFAREGKGLAGVFALSGGLVGLADHGQPDPALYGHADKDLSYSGPRSGQVWISVHTRDPHIPLRRVEDSAAALRKAGATVEMRVFPGAGHAVMREDIAALRRHLNR